MLKSPWVPIVACLLYGLFIVAGQAYFSTRPPWNLRRLLALWNLALSVFSFVGLVRVLPAILHMWATYSRKENFCMDPESSFGSGSTGLWVQLFVLSKFPYVTQACRIFSSSIDLLLDSPTQLHIVHSELFDTFFIVVHKKPLIFLHWYVTQRSRRSA
jgi:elongation of very long chain fatty acids protein 6